jgi:hypothetical protein
MAVAVAPKVRVAPIEDADAPRVAAFLAANMDSHLPAAVWERALDVPWPDDRPNSGFLLLAGADVVGVQLAFYSERTIGGHRERFCNLAAWCVLPAHRLHSLKLVRAVLAQDGYTFVDLSPSGNVVALNERLGFAHLDTTTSLVPTLPWCSPVTTITSDPDLLERTLTGRDLAIFRDHRRACAARHVLLRRGEDSCYVIFRKARRKGLPVFASLLHVSDPALLRRLMRPFCGHLLLRHGVVAVLAEHRVAGRPPRSSVRLRSSRPKMFRSAHLEPADVDDLYSELVSVPW